MPDTAADDHIPKGRIEALADGVFAIAMTLLAFNLQAPASVSIRDNGDLQSALLAMLPSLKTYVLSFLVIGIYWISHHFQFHYVRRADRTLLWIDIFFLMAVATLPFSTAVLGRYEHYRSAIVLYSLNLLLVGLVNAIQWAYVTHGRRLVAPDLSAEVVRITMARILLAPSVAVICIAISFFSVSVAVNFYYVILILYVLLARRHAQTVRGDTI
jgi:TMEM175 potassium channel family protein